MNLRDRFEEIDREEINQFVNEGKQETLHLDFKELKGNSFNSQDDRRNLAKALSGFANSDGGIIVWGIEARKDEEGVDRAVAEKPIQGLNKLLTRLNELTGDFVSPHVEGVEHKIIEIKDGEGFAVTVIPASDIGPHMAGNTEHRYYKRSGSGFYVMEHFDVADMFGRRRKPRMGLEVGLGKMGSGGNSRMLTIYVRLRNSGRGVAKAPYISIGVNKPYTLSEFGPDGNYGFGMSRIPHGGNKHNFDRFGSRDGLVIHPGTYIDITVIRADVDITKEEGPDLEINYEIGAEDVPLTLDKKIIKYKELLDFARK